MQSCTLKPLLLQMSSQKERMHMQILTFRFSGYYSQQKMSITMDIPMYICLLTATNQAFLQRSQPEVRTGGEIPIFHVSGQAASRPAIDFLQCEIMVISNQNEPVARTVSQQPS